MPEYTHIRRTFGPVYDNNSRIIILGSFPSVRSREANFYYCHPQNRFWPLLARLLECEMPESIEGKKEVLLKNRIALWDALDSCDIIGSSDSSIKNAVPVDIMQILNSADIRKIFCNGGASHTLFIKYLTPLCGITPVKLPSTSPANATWSVDRLYSEWAQIKEFL